MSRSEIPIIERRPCEGGCGTGIFFGNLCVPCQIFKDFLEKEERKMYMEEKNVDGSGNLITQTADGFEIKIPVRIPEDMQAERSADVVSVGDVVQLNSGGPRMTVHELIDGEGDVKMATVAWFASNEHQVESVILDVRCLRKLGF